MPNHDIQVVLHNANGLPQDDYVNTLHYEINAPDTVEGTCDDIKAAYQGFIGFMSDDINGMTIRVYDPGLNPGGPSFTKNYAFAPAIAGGASELACCLSYATVDNPDASTPRRRGRIYLGPLSGSATGQKRPITTLRTGVLALGQALAAAGNAGNSTWLMYSQTDGTYSKIESIWVDDAWDVQRRRGLAPTLRTAQDVQ